MPDILEVLNQSAKQSLAGKTANSGGVRKKYPSDTMHNEYQRRYKEKYPWVRTMSSIRTRCNHKCHKAYKNYGGKGIKCLITMAELKMLWFRDMAYLLKEPSIDRIDSKGNYCVGNCRYIEWSENRSRYRREKTHCIRGHEFNEVNTYIAKHNGSRACRTCKFMSIEERNEALATINRLREDL